MSVKKRTLFNQKSMNMTQGQILPLLVRFAIPILLGNIFQQLYNMVDTWVVGNYVSNEAFSAVGSVGPIINSLIGFFLGLSSGAGVMVSQYFGAGDEEDVSKTVHTAFIMTVVFAVLVTVAGFLFTPVFLNMMRTPPEVMPESLAYLRVYFAGISGLMLYNIGAAILQAIGDSRSPFVFLTISAALNIAGDLIFVLVFDMGVSGVAWATVIAQAISALLVIATLIKTDTCVKLRLSLLRFDREKFERIVSIGIPAGLQMAITSFSNIFVQSYINYFGADCMSGWTAYGKIDSVMILPMRAVSVAATTFAGQNIGVGDDERVKNGIKIAHRLSFVLLGISMLPVMLFAPQLVAFFNAKAEVVALGALIIRVMSPCYFIICVYDVLIGVMRGAGETKAPMFIMLFSFVIFRQIYLYVMTNYIANEIVPVIMGYPLGWLSCAILTVIYFRKSEKTRKYAR
ncbi:MAG: MATE family efflux transporter [Clostridiales bacterium]|nr:MATE family efflux transporter [Clostridiales bacterium]